MENEGSKRVTPDFSHLFQSEPYHFFLRERKYASGAGWGLGEGLGGRDRGRRRERIPTSLHAERGIPHGAHFRTLQS